MPCVVVAPTSILWQAEAVIEDVEKYGNDYQCGYHCLCYFEIIRVIAAGAAGEILKSATD